MQTANPVFNSQTFQQAPSWQSALGSVADRPATMSVRGTALKTLYLLAITAASAAASWGMYQGNPGAILPTMIGSLIGSLVAGIIILKKPTIAGFVVPVFAFAEGLFVAAISVAIIEFSSLSQRIGGNGYEVVGQAAGLTFAIAAAMLLGYASGLLRLSNFMMKMIVVMTAGVMIYYVGAFLINLITRSETVPFLGNDASPIGIAFSVFVVSLASLNLLLDFQYIDQGVQKGLPRHYEWIGAFGLLTTLVWLYIEMLRLLAKLRSE